jgi:hypothetical protein
VRGARTPICEGPTCDDPEYLDWLFKLRDAGFEIGFHMATFHSSLREETIAGLEKFEKIFAVKQGCMANHVGCLENIYWGSYRLTGVNRWIYNLLTRFHHRRVSYGHLEGDKHFWGDICKDRIKYVRNFVFPEMNTLKVCPFMPYHDPKRPFVNYWYASSEGSTATSFTQCITEAAQDRLEEEGGACIMYAHLACGFFKDGRLDPQFEKLMTRLSQKNGWFVPVSTLLDYLLERNGNHVITDGERNRLERGWLWRKIRVGTS